MSRAERLEREARLSGNPITFDATAYYSRLHHLEATAHRARTVGAWQSYLKHVTGHLSVIEDSGDEPVFADALDRIDYAMSNLREVTGYDAD